MCLFLKRCSLILKHVELTIQKIKLVQIGPSEKQNKKENGKSSTTSFIAKEDSYGAATYCTFFRTSLQTKQKIASSHWIFC